VGQDSWVVDTYSFPSPGSATPLFWDMCLGWQWLFLLSSLLNAVWSAREGTHHKFSPGLLDPRGHLSVQPARGQWRGFPAFQKLSDPEKPKDYSPLPLIMCNHSSWKFSVWTQRLSVVFFTLHNWEGNVSSLRTRANTFIEEFHTGRYLWWAGREHSKQWMCKMHQSRTQMYVSSTHDHQRNCRGERH
jgi:hypothetical protein